MSSTISIPYSDRMRVCGIGSFNYSFYIQEIKAGKEEEEEGDGSDTRFNLDIPKTLNIIHQEHRPGLTSPASTTSERMSQIFQKHKFKILAASIFIVSIPFLYLILRYKAKKEQQIWTEISKNIRNHWELHKISVIQELLKQINENTGTSENNFDNLRIFARNPEINKALNFFMVNLSITVNYEKIEQLIIPLLKEMNEKKLFNFESQPKLPKAHWELYEQAFQTYAENIILSL